MSKRKRIHCCGCDEKIRARLTNGSEVYPHRKDLSHVPMWKCDRCSNHVGCHPGTIQPLGNIATAELRNARTQIHNILDPLWKSRVISRKKLYDMISEELGYPYHTGKLKTMDEARLVWKIVRRYQNRVTGQ